MTEFKEEAYVLEKMEISEDDDEGFEYKEIRESEVDIEDPAIESVGLDEDDDDLDDFLALKTKTELKRIQATKAKGGIVVEEHLPKTIQRDVVIDDFIRNFLQKFEMSKTLNVFQQEWHELQKKGTFHDVQIGLITDMQNKNTKLRKKIETMKVELREANIIANQAKSTWEKLRKERDFHKTHQDRVNGEKVTLTSNIKAMKDQLEDYEEKIEEIQRKQLQAVKEKALLKLDKDKAAKRAFEIQQAIKAHEEKVQKQIDANLKK